MQKFKYMQLLKARGYHRCPICDGMGTTADRFSHRIDTCGQCNGVGMVKHQHRVASIVELERVSIVKHWPEYHMAIFEQVRDWLIKDRIPRKEAVQHAHRVVSVIPDVFKNAVQPGSVINTLHMETIGTGIVSVIEKGVEHEADGLWMYIPTSRGTKYFGICNMPNTSTGHMLIMRADSEQPLASYDPINNAPK